MILNFEYLHVHNFLSFEDSQLDLSTTGYCLVSGVNRNIDDNAVSNGSGKSSIWEAILWCLTGDTLRGCKSVVRLGENDGCYVELTFKVDDTEYRLLRSKDSKLYKTNLKIYVNDEDKSGKGIRDSEKILQSYLPDLTTSLIGSVIILGQGLPQRFTSNTPSGRKEILEQLSKSDFMIQDLKDRITKRKSFLSTELRTHQDKQLQVQTETGIYEKQLEDEKNKLSYLESINIDDSKNKIEELTAKVNECDLNISSSQAELSNSMAENNLIQSKLRSINQELTDSIDKISDFYYSQEVELKNKIQDISINLSAKKNELIRLSNIKDVCPTCGQKLVGVEKPDVEPLKNTIQILSSELAEYNSKNEALQKKIKDEKLECKITYNKLSDEYLSKSKDIAYNYNYSQGNINRYTAEKNKCMSEITKLNQQISSIENDIILSKERILELENKIDQLKLYNINEQQNIENLLSRQTVMNKFDTLIKRDFRGYLLQSVIEFIQGRAKEYCKDIFLTDKIDFKLDGNNISISYLGKEYESLSGGEKQKVDLIIQFSIRDMLCKYLNFSSNILVLDEVTDNLDSLGCQNVINFISSKVEDVSSVYIISHRKDLDIPCDREVAVEKSENGISKIIDHAVYKT